MIRITGSPKFVADHASGAVVAPVRAKLAGAPLSNGTGQCSSNDSNTDVVVMSTDSGVPGTVAYVLAGDALISLSGRSVTPKTVAAIARALRPV